MFITTQRIRVEWSHCDPAGIIFNPHYYIWMDQGSHGLLRAAGFDLFAEVRNASEFIGCPLVASNMQFKHPLRFGDVTTMESTAAKFTERSITIEHRFMLEQRVVAHGSEVRVWGTRHPDNPDGLIAREIPSDVVALLSQASRIDISV